MIDKVRFINPQNKQSFIPDWIELNSGLNTIIGGKSAGKSLLLYYIAKTIDSKQVKEKVSPLQTYDFDSVNSFDFEVVWEDESKISLRTEQDIKRKIVYIPQNYLSKLSEDCVPTRKALNDFVFNTICCFR